MKTSELRQFIREEILKELESIDFPQTIDPLTEATEMISMVANQLKSKGMDDLAKTLIMANLKIQDVQNSLTTEPYIG